MINDACKYSFDDLHQARFGRVMTSEEKTELYSLSQQKRNEKVGEWAKKIGWQTEDIASQEGIVYRSFWPSN